MRFTLLALAGALGLAQATVPSDLASGFNAQMNLQVSYSQNVSNNNPDGQQYSQQQAMYQPNFGLYGSSNAQSDQQFVIIAVDTTDANQWYLHYVHQGYQMTNVNSILASQSAPYMGWWAPGYLGESGQGRSYSFLLYQQPQNFQVQNLPQLGQQVQMSQFASDCGLQDAVAGISVTVDVVQANDGYNNYQSQYNSNGGYGSYWNYMPQYDQYNMGYNQNGQYGNQCEQGWNEYQYQTSEQNTYSTYQQNTYQQNTYQQSTYQQNTYQQNTYQQNTYQQNTYQQNTWNTYQQYTTPAYSAAPSYQTAWTPPASYGVAPPYPTGGVPAAASAAPSGAPFPSSSPLAASTSPLPATFTGAAAPIRGGAFGAVVAGAGMAGFAAVML